MPQESDPVLQMLRDAETHCAQHNTRLTELRATVLELILRSPTPQTAYQLLDRLRDKRRGAVPPTVYRALDFLMQQGLVHRIERLNAFVSCHAHGGHGHPAQFLICRRCGTVAEIEDREVSEALHRAAARAGFHAGVATVELDGTCAACG